MTDLQQKPKWQRARIVSAYETYRYCIGQELWVIGQPEDDGRTSYDPQTNTPVEGAEGPSYDTNLMDPDGRDISVRANRLELLARDENDFADDVDLIPWEQFLAQCKENAGGSA
jgi:hypothetical protein